VTAAEALQSNSTLDRDHEGEHVDGWSNDSTTTTGASAVPALASGAQLPDLSKRKILMFYVYALWGCLYASQRPISICGASTLPAYSVSM
jgi:hypothetical protein